MKLALLYLSCMYPILTVAQQAIEVRGAVMEVSPFTEIINNSKYNAVEGTPYLSDAFTPAKINSIEKTQFIRFNVVDHIVEVKIKANKVVMLDLKNDFLISLLDGSNKRYTTALCLDGGVKTKSFFEILKEDERYNLYGQKQKKYVKEQKAEGYQEKLPPRFIDQTPKYFITDFRSDTPIILELPTKRKKFISIFGADSKMMEKYLKKERLDPAKRDDLFKIFDFYFSSKP